MAIVRPLVLLDVDGVINDLRRGVDRPWFTFYYEELGYTISVPEYMPELLARVHAIADIVWCTTWADRANVHISPLVGLPTILDFVPLAYTDYTVTGSKFPGAHRFASPYARAGVPVTWVEDFDRMPKFNFEITLIDTVPEYVLTPELGETLIKSITRRKATDSKPAKPLLPPPGPGKRRE